MKIEDKYINKYAGRRVLGPDEKTGIFSWQSCYDEKIVYIEYPPEPGYKGGKIRVLPEDFFRDWIWIDKVLLEWTDPENFTEIDAYDDYVLLDNGKLLVSGQRYNSDQWADFKIPPSKMREVYEKLKDIFEL